MTTEFGRDMAPETGEHVHVGRLDFDAWAYLRNGSGFTICGRQMPPQPMLDAMGTPNIAPTHWTVNYGGNPPFATFLPYCEAEDDAPRVSFDTLPDDIKALVITHASEGWVWDGYEHRYDPDLDEWVPTPSEGGR